jgi:hypothetical protein
MLIYSLSESYMKKIRKRYLKHIRDDEGDDSSNNKYMIIWFYLARIKSQNGKLFGNCDYLCIGVVMTINNWLNRRLCTSLFAQFAAFLGVFSSNIRVVKLKDSSNFKLGMTH